MDMLLLQTFALPICLIFFSPTTAQQSELPPKPELGGIEAPIRKMMEEARERLEVIATDQTARPADLAAELGRLGELYLAHDLEDAAEAVFEQSLLLAPKEQRFAFYLGLISEQRQQPQKALQRFSRVLQIDRNNLFARAHLGYVYLSLNQPQQARTVFQKALETAGEEAFLLNGLGRAAADLGEYKLAVDYFEQVLARFPTATSVHEPLGQALTKLGEEDKARAHLLQLGSGKIPFSNPYMSRLEEQAAAARFRVVRAMAAEKGAFSGPDYRATIQDNFGNRPAAVDFFLDAIDDATFNQKDAQPTELARLHYAAAILFADKQEYLDATEQLEAAIKRAPKFPEPYMELGRVLRSQKKNLHALDAYGALLGLLPKHTGALLARASVYRELKREPEAIADLTRLLADQPDKKEALLALAILYRETADGESAVTLLKKLLTMPLDNSQRVTCLNEFGLLLQNRGSHQEAVPYYQESLQLNPAQPAVSLNLATALSILADYVAAIPHYQAVVKAEPKNLPAWLGGIAALILSDQLPMARTALTDAVHNLPENKRLSHLYARFLAAAPDLALRDGKRAVVLAGALFDAEKNVHFAETFAMAQAQAGLFERAVQLQTELITFIGDRAGADMVDRLQANLERYKQGLACCAENTHSVLLP